MIELLVHTAGKAGHVLLLLLWRSNKVAVLLVAGLITSEKNQQQAKKAKR